MFRIGHYTGNVYSIDADLKTIGECCSIVEQDPYHGNLMDLGDLLHARYCENCTGGCKEERKANSHMKQIKK